MDRNRELVPGSWSCTCSLVRERGPSDQLRAVGQYCQTFSYRIISTDFLKEKKEKKGSKAF